MVSIMNWLVFSILAVVFWGFWGFFIKLASTQLSWQQVFIVTSSVTLVFSLLTFVIAKPSFEIGSQGLYYALTAGVLGAFALIFFNMAIKEGDALVVVPLTSLYPVITVVLSYFILSEKLTATKGLGIILALIAIILVSI
jgi:transporter family protein